MADKRDLFLLEQKLKTSVAANIHGSLSFDDFEVMRQIEKKREDLLTQAEKEWRLKSRAIWITHGDRNTKFFHSFASARRNRKHIWEIENDRGLILSGMDQIKAEAVSYFGDIYKDPGASNLPDQIRVASLFPRFVNEQEAVRLQEEVSLDEIESQE